jgi:hypothetical protein
MHSTKSTVRAVEGSTAIARSFIGGDVGRPRSVDLLWGSRERSSRGPKPGLSLDAIVAIAIVDAEGLAALTMGRVAEALDITTMALYR